MSADTFADTNVLAYLVSSDAGRRAVARAVFAGQPVISTQVVNEFLNVCLRKAKLEREAAHALATGLMTGCETRPVTAEAVHEATRIGLRYGFSHWDALIVAAALAAGCRVLFSEDLQDGQVIDGCLTVVNPFVLSTH